MALYLGALCASGFAHLAPGELAFAPAEGGEALRVADGDTLTCSCGRSAARGGRCHRVWAAWALCVAGWRVVLDGHEVDIRDAEREVLSRSW